MDETWLTAWNQEEACVFLKPSRSRYPNADSLYVSNVTRLSVFDSRKWILVGLHCKWGDDVLFCTLNNEILIFKYSSFWNDRDWDASFNFSVRTLTFVTYLRSWAQLPHIFTGLTECSFRPFGFRLGGLVDFLRIWKSAVLEVNGPSVVTTPRIFRVIISPSIFHSRMPCSLLCPLHKVVLTSREWSSVLRYHREMPQWFYA